MTHGTSVIQSRLQWRVRLVVLLCWLGILIIIFSHQVWPSVSIKGVVIALIFAVPLFVPLRGLLRGDRYTYKWATLCVLPYFLVGTTEAVANPALHRWAVTLLGMSLMWFFSLIAYLRVSRNN